MVMACVILALVAAAVGYHFLRRWDAAERSVLALGLTAVRNRRVAWSVGALIDSSQFI